MSKKDKDILFSAILELENISGKVVKFKVKGSDGANVLNLHHIEIDRKDFPKDDNFNMDFINSNLDKAERPGVPKKLRKEEEIAEANKQIDKAQEKMLKKQSDYKTMTRYELVIKKIV